LEEAGCGGVGLPGTETLPVVEQDLQQQAGVAGIRDSALHWKHSGRAYSGAAPGN
jgi:hypothetical protein